MKKVGCFLVLSLLSLLPSIAVSADFGVSSTTIFGIEQRAYPGFPKQTVAPATQFLEVDVDKLADGNLSMHLYGWERVDLSRRSTNEGYNDGDLTYGYLKYRFPKSNGVIKAGRFFINEGVAMEQIDGVSARVDLQKGFTLSAFAGAPVLLDRDKKSKGDYIFGGRGSYRLAKYFEIGVSGLQEGGVTLDPMHGKKDRQMVGVDLWLSPIRMVELNGHSYYNAATGGIAEHSYLLTIKPIKTLTISGLYNENRFKNYFTFSNLRSLFNPDNGGELKYYGGGVSWIVIAPVEVNVDYKHYNRFSNVTTDSNGNSNRYGGEVRLTLLDKKVRSGVAYHRSEGEGRFNSYHEARAYALYDSGKIVASLDGITQFYKNQIYGKKQAYEVIGSTGYRILPNLVISGDLSYGKNPQYNEELRGLIRLTFNYDSASKGVKK